VPQEHAEKPFSRLTPFGPRALPKDIGTMRPAAPYGDLRGRDGPLTPSPLTASATMKDLGPLPDSRGRESRPEQMEGQGVGAREASAHFSQPARSPAGKPVAAGGIGLECEAQGPTGATG